MMAESGANKILKNTLTLYVRMIFLTIISLFTYRIVFQALGAENYGTYNVIGGFVAMFAFVSGTMTIASQRYFAIGLANNNWEEVNKYFSINIVIYVILSIVIMVLAETIGLWFVLNKLNVDYSRITDIIIVYETSILSFLIGMFVSPFLALLVADENIAVYSWVSVIEGILKVVVAYVLHIFQGEKLVVYSFLLLGVSVITNGVYIFYCIRKYNKLKFKLCRERKQYKTVFLYINWNFIGAIAAVAKSQGVNIIINIFFGTVVNAARAIAYQLNSVISSFAQNFMKAVDPHIMKVYASEKEKEFISAIYISSKISYYLLLIIAIPFIANVEYVLTLWLGEIPKYTTIFTTLALVDTLILSITDPILTAVQVIGKIRRYQLTVGILSLMNLPVVYILLKLTQNAVVPFVVAVVIDVFITVGRLINFKMVHDFSIMKYSLNIFLPAIMVTVLSAVVNMVFLSGADSFSTLIFNVLVCIAVMILVIIGIGLNKKERNILKRIIPSIGRKNDRAGI